MSHRHSPQGHWGLPGLLGPCAGGQGQLRGGDVPGTHQISSQWGHTGFGQHRPCEAPRARGRLPTAAPGRECPKKTSKAIRPEAPSSFPKKKKKRGRNFFSRPRRDSLRTNAGRRSFIIRSLEGAGSPVPAARLKVGSFCFPSLFLFLTIAFSPLTKIARGENISSANMPPLSENCRDAGKTGQDTGAVVESSTTRAETPCDALIHRHCTRGKLRPAG